MTARRLVHLGIGNFARAHVLKYTADATALPGADTWTAAVFTGRSPRMAETLNAQDGRYGLVVRGPEGDTAEIIDVIEGAYAADDRAALERLVSDPATSVVTLTITEKGYQAGTDPAASAPARLALALRARREAGVEEPIALISCDNLPGNGPVLERAVREALEAEGDRETLAWLEGHVDVISSMVDRITPAAGDAEQQVVAEQTGLQDAAPVVTEPFSEWVLEDAFRAARPAWEQVGVQLADDLAVHEERKLRFLNGAHSLMAYAGQLKGHETVPAAIADEEIRGFVTELWAEDVRTVRLPAVVLADYQEALLERFENRRLADQLIRIAADGSAKLPVRHLPVIAEAGGPAEAPGAVRAVAAWCAWVTQRARDGHPVDDPHGGAIAMAALLEDPQERIPALLALLGEDAVDAAGGAALAEAVQAAEDTLPGR